MIPRARNLAAVLIMVAAAMIIACRGGGSDNSQSQLQECKALIPYKVIDRQEVGDARLSIDVYVDLIDGRLPTKEQLGAISEHLAKGQRHERKFVGFYLPGMKVNAGYFATAHHLPNMQVKILDVNLPEKYRKLLRE